MFIFFNPYLLSSFSGLFKYYTALQLLLQKSIVYLIKLFSISVSLHYFRRFPVIITAWKSWRMYTLCLQNYFNCLQHVSLHFKLVLLSLAFIFNLFVYILFIGLSWVNTERLMTSDKIGDCISKTLTILVLYVYTTCWLSGHYLITGSLGVWGCGLESQSHPISYVIYCHSTW